MEYTAGQFDRPFANYKGNTGTFTITWTSLPANHQESFIGFDRFEITIRIYSANEEKFIERHYLTVAQQNGTWFVGRINNQLFNRHDSDLSKEIAQAVVNDYESSLTIPRVNDGFFDDL